jgi:hypothetical protein
MSTTRATVEAIRCRLDAIGTVATTAADALADDPAIDMPPTAPAAILAELVSLDRRLDLALDRLAGALEPAPCGR